MSDSDREFLATLLELIEDGGKGLDVLGAMRKIEDDKTRSLEIVAAHMRRAAESSQMLDLNPTCFALSCLTVAVSIVVGDMLGEKAEPDEGDLMALNFAMESALGHNLDLHKEKRLKVKRKEAENV